MKRLLIVGAFFYLAIKEAKKSTHKFRLGAIVLNKRKVVSKGFNKKKSHPKVYSRCIHAETDALLSIKKQKPIDSILVVRLRKDGNLSCAKPCFHCQKKIKEMGLKKVYYSDWCGTIKMMDMNA